MKQLCNNNVSAHNKFYLVLDYRWQFFKLETDY